MEPSKKDVQGHELLKGAELLRHAAWIRRLALGLVGDASLAEDLVQDTWLAALRRPPSSDRSLRPWLGTVLRNAARQAFRGQGRRAQRERGAPQPAPVATPEELAQRLEVERRLTDELARLAEPFRSTVMLRFYEGLEPSEIARRQGLPPGTVRWRLKRGLDELRERLDDRFGERAHWSVLFLSLMRPDRVPWKGVAAAAVPGVLTMHVLTKIGIGAAALVTLAIGLRLGGALPDELWPLAGERPAALSMRPYVPPADVLVAAEGPVSEVGARQAVAVVSAAERSPEAAAAAPAPLTAIVARAVDQAGGAITKARLRLLEPGAPRPAASDRDGQLSLEFPDPSTRRRTVELALGAPGFESRGVAAVVSPGETTYLGTIALAPGGAVSGFVRDADGRPVGAAQVTLGATDAPRQQLESLRLQSAPSSVPETLTSAAGTFTLEGAPAGFVRVWVHKQGYLASYSAPVEVRAGQESFGLELVLEALSPANRIAGIVLDPEGAPVPGARLDYRHRSRSSGVTMAGDDRADERGRFEFLVPKDTELWLTAQDPEQVWGPGSVSGARTASGELVVRLTPAARFEVRALEPSGAPVPRFAIAVLSADGEFERSSLPRAEHEDGRVQVRRPTEPFLLRVTAPGHELAQVGPLDPDGLADSLPVVLQPLPGLHGRVWLGERPAAGAEVSLHPLVSPRSVYERNGFLTLVRDAIDTAHSDEQGRFLLTPREPGRYVVRAEHAGSAPAVSATIELGPGLAYGEIALELTPGGAIEGRVVRADGGDPSGTIVGLSRGDGHDRTVRVGPEGAYRFELLTPGPWLLVEREEEIRPGRTVSSTSDNRRTREIEWTCQVVEGRTTHHDLVLGEAEACVLTGRLSIAGRVPAGWRATLIEEEAFFADGGAQRVLLDPAGGFRVSAPEPGRYWLVLSGGEGAAEQFLLDLVHLEWGTQDWEYELETGALRVTGVPSWEGDGIPAFVHLWEGPGSLKAFTVLSGDADGLALVPSIAAGQGRIVRPDPTQMDFDRWPTVLTLEVPRGGTGSAQLP